MNIFEARNIADNLLESHKFIDMWIAAAVLIKFSHEHEDHARSDRVWKKIWGVKP